MNYVTSKLNADSLNSYLQLHNNVSGRSRSSVTNSLEIDTNNAIQFLNGSTESALFLYILDEIDISIPNTFFIGL